MSNLKKDFVPGDLVLFKIKDKISTIEGYTSGSPVHRSNGAGLENDKIYLYEIIDIENFPSFNDFAGKKVLISHNDMAMVIRKVGTPFKLRLEKEKNDYIVYEVMTIENVICQVFSYNIASML